MFANVDWGRDRSGLLTIEDVLRSWSRRGKKFLAMESFTMRAFETIAFNGDASNDDVQKGVRRRRGVKIVCNSGFYFIWVSLR